MASIREHHGAWQVRYRDPNGRMRSRSFRLKTEAGRFARAVETDVDRGDWQDPVLARAVFERYALDWLASASHLKPKTVAGYRSLLRTRILPTFGAMSLGKITPQQVRSWAAALDAGGLSSSRQRQAVQLLREVLGAAVESGHLRRSPVVGVKVRPTPKREIRVLEPETVDVLARTIRGPGYEALVNVMSYGGLRWGEVVALQRADVDPLRSRLRVERSVAEVGGRLYAGPTKTYARRYARVPRWVSEMLAEHLARSVAPGAEALVFTSPEGTTLRHGNFLRRAWMPASAAAGIPEARPHDLRHTCASLLIRRGASVRAVAEQLGHSSPVVTLSIYAHVFEGDLDRLFDGFDADRPSTDVAQAWPKGQIGGSRAGG